MRKKTLLVGTLAAASVVALVFSNATTTQEEIPAYEPRTLSSAAEVSDGHTEIWEQLRANVNTGKYEHSDYLRAKKEFKLFAGHKAASLSFSEEGPDNIGGRTRAILIDKDNTNLVYAGSVSGGLFISYNKGNNWERVESFEPTLSVSSMTQAADGTVYIGTGSSFESNNGSVESGGHNGDGIWWTRDWGATVQQVPGTAGWTNINEVVADPSSNNKIWVAGISPIKLSSFEADPATATGAEWNIHSDITSSVLDVKISPDGQHLVCGMALAGIVRTYVSHDGGTTFTNVSGLGAGQIPSSGNLRNEYAISFDKNTDDKWNIYASMTDNNLRGVWMSNDNGDTWYEIAPASTTSFSPFSNGLTNQGQYDQIISAIPGHPDQVLLGGINLHKWTQATNNPPYGQWEQKSLNFAAVSSPLYVHSDNHEMKWDADGRLYVGNDGGVHQSLDNGEFYYQSNRGYNVTQFYSVAYSSEGHVLGGTQDNGTLYNDHNGNTWAEFTEVRGGDGFDCDISYLNPDAMIASIYYSLVGRSDNGSSGGQWDPFISTRMDPAGAAGQNLGSFYTTGRLWENPNDINSQDSLTYIPRETLNPGDTAVYLSTTLSIEQEVIVTQQLLFFDTAYYSGRYQPGDSLHYFIHPNTGDTLNWGFDSIKYDYALDSLRVQDKVQTWYAMGVGDDLWITREALRFSTNPLWVRLTNFSGGANIQCVEFDTSGNYCYFGTRGGKAYRVSGLNTLYYNNQSAFDNVIAHADAELGTQDWVTITEIHNASGQVVSGIAIDPQDPDHVVLTLAGYAAATNIVQSMDATGAATFTSIQGNMPSVPIFDAIIDRNDPNLIVAGTEFGVMASDDGGASWTAQNNELGNVPVFAVRQDWRTWAQGSKHPGMIYLGTHGRGIWRSGSVLSEPDLGELDPEVGFISKLNVYPNPMNVTGNISFDLASKTDVVVRVFNLQGQQVDYMIFPRMGAGNQTVELDVAKLAIGTYVVSLEAGDHMEVAKFVRTK